MKKSISALATSAVLAAVFVAGCGGAHDPTPESTAEDLARAVFEKGDADSLSKLRDLAVDDWTYKSYLRDASSVPTEMSSRFTVTEATSKEKGNGIVHVDLSLLFPNGREGAFSADVVKTNGTWKVCRERPAEEKPQPVSKPQKKKSGKTDKVKKKNKN